MNQDDLLFPKSQISKWDPYFIERGGPKYYFGTPFQNLILSTYILSTARTIFDMNMINTPKKTTKRGAINQCTAISVEEFADWLSKANAGAVLLYATATAFLENCDATAELARAAFLSGRASLLQRRVLGGFEYLAVARREVVPPAYPWDGVSFDAPARGNK
jgi:hypothetical protein